MHHTVPDFVPIDQTITVIRPFFDCQGFFWPTLAYDLDFQSPASYGHSAYTRKKSVGSKNRVESDS